MEFTCSDGSCVGMDLRCDGSIQCRDGSDERGCRILDYSVGYDKLLPPPDEKTGKTQVMMSVEVINILEIHEVDESIKIRFIIKRSFFDQRLTYRNLKPGTNKNRLSRDEENSVWKPWLIFYNVAVKSNIEDFDRTIHSINMSPKKAPRKAELTYNNNVYLYKGSEHYQVIEMDYTITWICVYDMSMYPFDNQICTMDFVIKDSETMNVVPHNLTYQGPMDLTQYFVHDYWMCSSQMGDGRQVVKVIITLGRPLMGNILTVYIPTLIVIIIGYMSKVFEKNYIDMVLEVNLTCILVLATL